MKIIRSNPSEATIQAELYWALKQAGLLPIMEQTVEINERTRTGRRAKIRCDIMLLDREDYALGVVEVKNLHAPVSAEAYSWSRQHRKYRVLGLPFTYCTTMGEIPRVVNWAKTLAPTP